VQASKLDQLRIDREPEPEGGGRWPWVLLVAVLLIAVATGAWFLRPPAALEVATVTVRQLPGNSAGTVLNASGYVTARRQATVSSKQTAQVLEVLIEEGMRVEQGQVLARLDDVNIRKDYELALAQLRSARTSSKETAALLREAEANLQRSRELVERELASRAELDRSRAAAESLAARLERIEADVTVAERRVAVFEQLLEDMVIRAPFDGVIVAKNAQPGEMISPVSAGGGFTRTGIGTLVDMSSLEIEIDVNEAYINRVQEGQRVVATLDAYPDWEIPAHVIAIIPTADRQKATVEVRVGFDDLDERILPDMGVKVAFQEEISGPGVSGVLVPRDALSERDGREVAFVVEQGAAERRAVATAGTREGDVIVVSGLSDGERVILDAPPELRDGQAVKILN
jgi:RND family efflux transporter MFP subunit